MSEEVRWRYVLGATVILAVLLLAAPPLPAGTTVHTITPTVAPVPFNTSVPSPSAVQTTTAGKTTITTQVWNQTGATVYAGHSSAWTNVTINPGTITATFSSTLTVATGISGYIPRLLVTQGATTLANTTSNLFVVNPVVSVSVPVTLRIVSLTNLTGSAPVSGLYTVSLNLRQSIQFDVVRTGSWTYNNTTYRMNWYVNSTNSYWLNQTAISVPFLSGAVINVSSLSVTVNNTPAVYQLAPNAVYILLTPVAPGASDTVRTSFRPVPSILGKPPNLYFAQFTLHGSTYTGQTFYTNYLTPAYDGVYVLHVNESFPITNLTISANGYVFPTSAYSVNGNNATLLPGVLTTYLSEQFLVMVTFRQASAHGSFPGASLVLLSYGNTTITLGETLLAAMVVDAVYIVAVASYWGPQFRRQFRTARTAVRAVASLWEPLFVLVMLLAFYLASTVVG